MKRLTIIIIAAIAAVAVRAQVDAPVAMSFEPLADRVTALEQSLRNATAREAVLADSIAALNRRLADTESRFNRDLREAADKQTAATDSLRNSTGAVCAQLATSINEVREDLGMSKTDIGRQISDTRLNTEKKMNFIWLYLIIGLLILALACAFIYLALRRRIGRGTVDIEEVKVANRKLAEQSVELDNKLASLLESQLKMNEDFKAIAAESSAVDHSLVLSVANEMARIEQNLAFMDPKTKGVSQLRNRAAAIAKSLKDKGYEIPQLVGTEYKEGYNMDVTMEEDETVEPGKMIIRRVVRPAVLFNGQMIQPASVAVAFNPEEE